MVDAPVARATCVFSHRVLPAWNLLQRPTSLRECLPSVSRRTRFHQRFAIVQPIVPVHSSGRVFALVPPEKRFLRYRRIRPTMHSHWTRGDTLLDRRWTFNPLWLEFRLPVRGFFCIYTGEIRKAQRECKCTIWRQVSQLVSPEGR